MYKITNKSHTNHHDYLENEQTWILPKFEFIKKQGKAQDGRTSSRALCLPPGLTLLLVRLSMNTGLRRLITGVRQGWVWVWLRGLNHVASFKAPRVRSSMEKEVWAGKLHVYCPVEVPTLSLYNKCHGWYIESDIAHKDWLHIPLFIQCGVLFYPYREEDHLLGCYLTFHSYSFVLSLSLLGDGRAPTDILILSPFFSCWTAFPITHIVF